MNHPKNSIQPPNHQSEQHSSGHQSSERQSFERLRAHAIAALVPFFIDGSTSDAKSARLVAESLLDDCNATTPKELQLATQRIALGWAAMACLRTAVAAKNLSVDDVLRLQDDALGLDRSSRKATNALEARRKERAKNPNAMTLQNTKWEEGVFQLAINQALEKLSAANAKLAAYTATSAPVEQSSKLSILCAEQMTPSVLARRARP